jgi:ABC-2 type transport system permease protein
MNYLRLIRVFFRVNIAGELAYRMNFLFSFFESVMGLAFTLVGLAVIFSYTDSLNGWRPNEILALVGVYSLLGGVIRVAILPGMQQLTESVRDGTFDFTLTKPEDAQLIVSISRIGVWKIIDVFLGLVILIIALVRLGGSIGGLQAVEFLAMLLTGSVIVYSFFLILATLAFWLVRVENILTIFLSVYHAGRWPLSLYPGWLRYGLIFIIPVAFATTIPVEALTSRLNWVTLVAAFAAAVVLFIASRAFWKFGLRHYSGASA